MNKTHHMHDTNRGKRAFTLSEVMMASGITILLSGMTIFILIAVSKIYIKSEIKNMVSEDYRSFTRLLAEQGNTSNGFYIYRSMKATDRLTAADQVEAGDSGDLVVFVYFSVKDVKTDPNQQGLTRIVGFFRETPGKVNSAIRWFDSSKQNWGQTFSPGNPITLPIPPNTDTNYAIEELLPPESFKSNCPVLAQHTMGAATGTSGGLKLFYNNTTTNNTPSLTVTGFILRARANSGGGVTGYESQTAFNLAITPRSN